MRLAGKTAIITGASSGIGQASALLWAAEGAQLLLADTNATRGGQLVQEIEASGGQAIFVETNVGQAAANQQLVAECVRQFGKLDILFCNAGINLPKLVTDTSDAELDNLLDVNLKSLVYATRAAIPVMLQQGGGVILITASKTGLVAQKDSPVYCATKGAAVLFAKALALDYATQNIRVNALCPGIINTPMLEDFARSRPNPQAAWQEYSQAQPMGRLGTPEECAQAALWLVSDEASFITGVALPVDGGFTAM